MLQKPNSFIRYKSPQIFGGGIVKNTLKFCITWIVGVIIAVFTMSLWRNEEVDWKLLFSVIVVALIGVLIVSGIMMYINKAKDKANE